MRAITNTIYSLSLLLLVGCAGGLSSNKQLNNSQSLGLIGIVSTEPAANSTNFPINGTIRVIFDQPVDAYSAIPENFFLIDEIGNRVGGEMIVSSRFIENPQKPGKATSEFSFQFRKRNLLPNHNYIFMWGQPDPENVRYDPASYGVQSLDGFTLVSSGFRFTTGSCRLNFANIGEAATQDCNFVDQENLKVVAQAPGKTLNGENLRNLDEEIGNVLSRDLNDSAITFAKRSPITLRFSESIVDEGSFVQQQILGFPPMPRTPIDNFGSMAVAVIDSDTKLPELLAQIGNANSSDSSWESFRDSYLNRINGTVYTSNDRKTLIFEPSEDYPDTGVQAVIVIVRNLVSTNGSEKILDENLYVGGFVHISDLRFDYPLSFNFTDFLNLPGGS